MSVLGLACSGGAPESVPLDVGTPPDTVLQAPVRLVEVVTADHFGPSKQSPPRTHAASEDFEKGLEGWSVRRGSEGKVDATGGRSGSAALVIGPTSSKRGPYWVRRFDVSGHEQCTVGAWVKTEGLVGQGTYAGARMEVMEMSAPRKEKPGRKQRVVDGMEERQWWRHLTHLAGDVDWTWQEVEMQVGGSTKALEVRLTAGHDGELYLGGPGGGQSGDQAVTSAGRAWFDDISVTCTAPTYTTRPGSEVAKAADPTVVRRVEIDDDNRPSVIVDERSAFSVQVDRSEDLTISTAVGLIQGTHKKAKVCFVVRLDGEEVGKKCRRGDKKSKRDWEPLTVNVPAKPGTSSRVSFETRVNSSKGVRPNLAAWADPEIVPTKPKADRPPDVLVLLVDTLRADSVNALYDRRPGATPRLDALAKTGTVYTQARSPACWTLASSATILTGQEPSEHGAGWRMRRGNRHSRPESDDERRLHYSGVVEDTPRLGSLVRDAGYLTRGWFANHWLDSRFGVGAGFSRWEAYKGGDIKGAGRVVDLVRDALEEQPLGGPRPQMLFVHVIDPHLPYYSHMPLPEGFHLPEDLTYETEEKYGMKAEVIRTTHVFKPEHAASLRETYDNNVYYLDQMVGEIIDMVGEDTMVVVTADHGEAFMEHNDYQHGGMIYEEVLRIPMMVRWPDGSHAGTKVDHPVILADATATVVDAVGGDKSDITGRKLPVPGETPESRVQVFSHVYFGPDRIGVLDWPYKRMVELPHIGLDPLVRRGGWPSDLYNIEDDPLETTDLSLTHPEVLDRMDALVAAEIDKSLPGFHLRCATPHEPIQLSADVSFVRGVPLSVGEVTISDDRRTITVAPAEGAETRLVVEAANGAEVTVEPAEACTVWDVAVPNQQVTLDQHQIDNLRAIGYME